MKKFSLLFVILVAFLATFVAPTVAQNTTDETKLYWNTEKGCTDYYLAHPNVLGHVPVARNYHLQKHDKAITFPLPKEEEGCYKMDPLAGTDSGGIIIRRGGDPTVYDNNVSRADRDPRCGNGLTLLIRFKDLLPAQPPEEAITASNGDGEKPAKPQTTVTLTGEQFASLLQQQQPGDCAMFLAAQTQQYAGVPPHDKKRTSVACHDKNGDLEATSSNGKEAKQVVSASDNIQTYATVPSAYSGPVVLVGESYWYYDPLFGVYRVSGDHEGRNNVFGPTPHNTNPPVNNGGVNTGCTVGYNCPVSGSGSTGTGNAQSRATGGNSTFVAGRTIAYVSGGGRHK